MDKETTIKGAIKTLLDTLKTGETPILGDVQIDDLRESIFDREVAAYPAAIICDPSVEAANFTNSQDERTYSVPVLVYQMRENITSTNTIGKIREAIMNKIANDPTLGGAADGAVEPSISVPEPTTIKGKSMVYFTILIKAKAIIDLSF